jgi:hypothetical protein
MWELGIFLLMYKMAVVAPSHFYEPKTDPASQLGCARRTPRLLEEGGGASLLVFL